MSSNPRSALRDPGTTRTARRDVGPVPLPGCSLGQRHLHAELPVRARGPARRRLPTATTSGDVPRPTPPDKHGIDRAHPVQHSRPRLRTGIRQTDTLDASRAEQDGADTHISHAGSCTSPPATTTTTIRYTPDFRGHRELHRRGGASPALARSRCDYTGKRGRGDRQRRHRGHASSRRWPERAGHVTMLQRSPELPHGRSPQVGPAGHGVSKAVAAAGWLISVVRMAVRVVLRPDCISSPSKAPSAGEVVAAGARRSTSLPDGYDVDTHFKPRYNPWDQRLCLILDADLYKAIAERPRRRASPTTSTTSTPPA